MRLKQRYILKLRLPKSRPVPFQEQTGLSFPQKNTRRKPSCRCSQKPPPRSYTVFFKECGELSVAAYAYHKADAFALGKIIKENEHLLKALDRVLDDLHKAVDVDRLKVIILRRAAGEEPREHLGPVDHELARVDKADIPLEHKHTVVVIVDKDGVLVALIMRFVCHGDEPAGLARALAAEKNTDQIQHLLPLYEDIIAQIRPRNNSAIWQIGE